MRVQYGRSRIATMVRISSFVHSPGCITSESAFLFISRRGTILLISPVVFMPKKFQVVGTYPSHITTLDALWYTSNILLTSLFRSLTSSWLIHTASAHTEKEEI